MRFRLLLISLVIAGCDYGRQAPPIVVDLPRTEVAPESQANPIPAFPVQETQETHFVVAVIDGDTIDVLTDDKQTKRIRLNAIDTPERGQPFGENAKQFLSDNVFNRNVQLIEHDVDRYGRTIADVIVDGNSVNLGLVASGLAWHYKLFSDDKELAQAERDAQAAALGLWSDPRHVAPWDWRKLSKEERDKLR